ncbi:DUF3244 domain-containing protein [uncultured Parabacteroides sp.]|uniref:DUF3244 domain-containing protein n=1 Tax=uncultured Parabacteroides sp. TaxID=512312 RepID=UPI00261CA5EF|nr:DUF3244 domain-containing protein [uncultured Parabacteroides sp.]
MKVKRLTLIALLFATFLIHPLFGDTIPIEGRWDDEYYRSADTNRPPVASIEGDILTLDFEDALSNLTVCVVNDKGVKVYEDIVSAEAGGTYSLSLAGEASGRYQVVLLHQLGYLTGDFTLE